MEFLGWFFGFMFWMIYIAAISPVCMPPFKKGHILLGIFGIFLPFLWLIGAIMPAKRGSRYETEQAMAQQARMQQMTS